MLNSSLGSPLRLRITDGHSVSQEFEASSFPEFTKEIKLAWQRLWQTGRKDTCLQLSVEHPQKPGVWVSAGFGSSWFHIVYVYSPFKQKDNHVNLWQMALQAASKVVWYDRQLDDFAGHFVD